MPSVRFGRPLAWAGLVALTLFLYSSIPACPPPPKARFIHRLYNSVPAQIVLPPYPRNPRVLVAIASFSTTGAAPPHLLSVIAALFAWPSTDIDVRIDTNSEDLASRLRSSFVAPLPVGRRLAVHVAPLPKMYGAGGSHCDETCMFKLTWVHRSWMNTTGDPLAWTFEQRDTGARPEYDHFLYLEDDVIIPVAAWQLYLSLQRTLELSGLQFQFTRVEESSGSPAAEQLVALDYFAQQIVDAPVFVDKSGGRWAVGMPFAALWLLPATQFVSFSQDSQQWPTGHPFFEIRESVAVGWMCELDLHRCVSRGLVPLKVSVTGQLHIHPDATVWHMPNKYVTIQPASFTIPLSRAFTWSQPPVEVAVPSLTNPDELVRWRKFQQKPQYADFLVRATTGFCL